MTSFTHTPAGDDEFDRLLDQSSVGTPEARAVSRAVASDRVDELVRLLAEDKDDFDEELADVVIADLDDEFIEFSDVAEVNDEFIDVAEVNDEFIDVDFIELYALPADDQVVCGDAIIIDSRDCTVGDLDGVWSIAADGAVTTRKAWGWGDQVASGSITGRVEEPARPHYEAQIAPPLPLAVAQASPPVGQQALAHAIDVGDHRRREVARLAERVRSHAMKFDAIRAEGFAGRRWERLLEDLARYGAAVTGSWMQSGHLVVDIDANELRPIGFSWVQVRELYCDRSFREELSARAVTKALAAFREATVAGTGWDHDGGVSLSTFIVNGCVHAFKSEFQRCSHWRELFTRQLGELTTAVVSEGATVYTPLPVAGVTEVLWWEVLGNLAMVIEDVTGVPAAQVGPQLRFVEDLGMDSIDAVEVGVHIEEIYDVRVPSVLLPAMHTVADAVDFIAAQCNPVAKRPTVWASVGSPPFPATGTPPTAFLKRGSTGGTDCIA